MMELWHWQRMLEINRKTNEKIDFLKSFSGRFKKQLVNRCSRQGYTGGFIEFLDMIDSYNLINNYNPGLN